MKLAIFDEDRLGLVHDDAIVDVTASLPHHDPGFGASFWVRFCGSFDELKDRVQSAALAGPRLPLGSVDLRAPVLNPGKIIAAAANYSDHVAEMSDVGEADWRLAFDVFLKSPSSIIGPMEHIILPDDDEIHYAT